MQSTITKYFYTPQSSVARVATVVCGCIGQQLASTSVTAQSFLYIAALITRANKNRYVIKK